MPLPVIARSVEERELLTSLALGAAACSTSSSSADVTFVGVGSIGEIRPLVQDGFITAAGGRGAAQRRRGRRDHRLGVRRARPGARRGRQRARRRRAAAKAGNRLVIGVAMGPSRRAPLRAALTGGLISGLVTDESTAEHLLQR